MWEHAGILCTGETYKDKVKLTFARGAALADPSRLFNASLDGNQRRAIDLHEGDEIDETAFKALIRAAVALNTVQSVRRISLRSIRATYYLLARQSACATLRLLRLPSLRKIPVAFEWKRPLGVRATGVISFTEVLEDRAEFRWR